MSDKDIEYDLSGLSTEEATCYIMSKSYRAEINKRRKEGDKVLNNILKKEADGKKSWYWWDLWMNRRRINE